MNAPDVYEAENRALQRDGRLDRALYELSPWDDEVLLDIGCGTGFWLPVYAKAAGRVIGVEPDQRLRQLANERVAGLSNVEVRAGSAEHLPVDDGMVDIVHARFAYFFGEWCGPGLEEARRVLKPGGRLLVVDNSWTGGDFADLLHRATTGNAALDPDQTAAWWAAQGATRHEVEGGWQAESPEELEQILKIEFPEDVVDEFLAERDSSSLSYNFAVYELDLG